MKSWLARCLTVALVIGGMAAVQGFGSPASAATPPQLALKILLIAQSSTDVTATAWQAALDTEGVPYTLVTAAGASGAMTVALPSLSSGNVGNYNGIVIADSPTNFDPAALAPLFAYESAFGVRQVDGDMFPSPALGASSVTSGALDGTTATLTAAGLAAMPQLKGPVPFDTGSFGNGATATAGAPYTSFLNNATGNTLGGVYQHPTSVSGIADPQAGVSELSLFFAYNANQTQWLLLSSGLINWVTQNTHLGLYRNYFGQDIDDVFIADNEWSSQYQCTPGATEPPDYACPAGVANNPADTPPDTLMSAADVAYVVAWEKQTGIRLNMAFNAVGACTGPTATSTAAACTGGVTENGTTYTLPGYAQDLTAANSSDLVTAMLANKAEFNWIMHTWSHAFLGCVNWQPQVLGGVTANASGGTFTAGGYSYQISAATAYGESEPSLPQTATVADNGSVTVTWPEASNGVGDDGTTAGPTLLQEKNSHTGGTAFWGYNVYRAPAGSTTYGLVGQVAENAAATAATTYSFTDTGATAGAAEGSGPLFPTATNPGIDCASAAGSWNPANSTSSDSIQQQIGLDQAWAAANGLTSLPTTQYTQSALVTGEHSGVENPNMPAALTATGVTTFAQDASRQPQQYTLGTALGAPRYPSNIYYNASNWADQLNEYNTLYVKPGVVIGPAIGGITPTGHCADTTSTTCRDTPATQADLLTAESHILLTHVLANNPRVGYAHQPNLIGPAGSGYTLLGLIDSMLAQYNAWYTDPLTQITDVSSAQTLLQQSTWAAAQTSGNVTASVTNGVVTVANSGAAVEIPVTVPAGTTVNGTAFGQAYGGQRSAWITVGSTPLVLNQNVAPTIISAASAASIVGAPFNFTVSTTGAPVAALSETGALPAGVSLTDNGNGTATIAGTPSAGTAASYPITITATNGTGTATQAFTLLNSGAPTITSATTAAFSTGVAGTYTVTTTGYPAPTITLSTGTLPTGLALLDKGDGTATISGSPVVEPGKSYPATYPVAISATNSSGSTSTLNLTITVSAATPPTITSVGSANFTLNSAGAVAITTTGSPIPVITETGAMPPGLSFADNGTGTALISGTPTATGTTVLTITATNGINPPATQSFTIIVGQAPTITTANAATFVAGTAGSFSVATTGYPAASLGASGLPAGVGFTDNHDGTATLSGTALAADAGALPVVLTAVNGTGTANQDFTFTVNAAPTFSSPAAAPFTVHQAGSFTVTTTGYPAATVTESGALPAGLTFTGNADGTATIAGTPTSGGIATVTLTAHNGVGADDTQTLTIAANAGPAFSSASSTTFTVGTAGSFSVTATGTPTAAITQTGLPADLSFADNGNGTATISGNPSAADAGIQTVTLTAKNANGTVTQTFTLAVTMAVAFTSAATTTFAAGQVSSFAVTTNGSPAATLTQTGALPAGLKFTSNANGTATISGTPAAGSQGTYPLTITASNGVGGDATQSFSLVINSGLAITSAASATATGGTAFSFTVTTSGTPVPTLTRTGTLPNGVTFSANNDGTATVAVSATSTAVGTFPLTFTAKNSTGTASQAFTLTINQKPTITSAATVTETVGTAFTFLVSATGFPTPAVSETGTLPSGLSFAPGTNGIGTLSGTTTIAAGTYSFTNTASNAGGVTTQVFSLVVKPKAAGTVPVFTSATSATATAGTAFTFQVTTAAQANVTTTLTRSGTLPAGVSFANNGNGTGTFSGKPTAASGGTYALTFTAKNTAGSTTQSFVLTVVAAPTITSAATAAATVGSTFNFTVKATGSPIPVISETGALPGGLALTDNGNGTATLTGTPTGAGGTFAISIKAVSSNGTATQAFQLTVNKAVAITSAASASAIVGKAFSFTFTATGSPAPSIARTGTLPRGVSFTKNANGTATLTGTPTVVGTSSLTITARNSLGSTTQAFTITVTAT